MKSVLITGSNRGIGFETARQLGLKGFHVVISGRDQAKISHALKALKKENISAEILLMDVGSEESVRIAAMDWKKRNQMLDVIINNAAILLKEDHSLLEQEHEIFSVTLNTNCHGPLRIIRAFLPHLNRPGKIINVSSGGGSMTDPVGGWSPAYCASKTLLNALTRQLAYELRSEEISVNALCPGWVRSDMGGRGAPRSLEKGAETPVWLASEVSHKITGKIFRDKKEIEW